MAKILVVDDEVGVCSELAELLEDDEHIVECAENAAMAIEKVKVTQYDAIFLDVLMPKVEGSEALRNIRQITGTPVVIMSAYLSGEIQKQVLASGAFACLKKPFKLKEVQALIDRAVQEKVK